MVLKRRLFCIFLLTMLTAIVVRAQVTGTVIDARTRQPLDFVNVYYDGKNVGDQTDEKGQFILKEDSTWTELTVATMGYVTQKVKLVPGKNKGLRIRLQPEPRQLMEVAVTAKKQKYSRKNNPAVELMRKVIAHKRANDLHSKDYFSYTKYEKMTFSINDVTEKVFDIGEGKQWAFLKDHVEFCQPTGKYILPMTIEETLSTIYYKKDPQTEKTQIKARNSRGVNELINTGEILTTVLQDCFTEIDIYDEECKLLRNRFKSPIANSAIGFYRYYIQDTLAIEKDSVIAIGFLPNNQQDIGFSGNVYIMKDSTYQVRRVELTIPGRSDINFVESMSIKMDYESVETGERVVSNSDMLIELQVNDWLGKLQVQDNVRNFDYTFVPIPKSVFKHVKGKVYTEPDAATHTDDAYWKDYRKVELTQSEAQMGSFLDNLTHIRGFKYLMIGVKALLENFVETSDSLQNNKFDFGPINTVISSNDYDKLRFRISGLTTAHLHPHLFWSGYVAYGTKTRNVYGKSELTYAFNKKSYLTREFPKNNLSVSYYNDITSPFDKFLPTDKDNMFTNFKASKVDQFTHTKEISVTYDREWYNGAQFATTFTRSSNRPVDKLFYQRLGTDPAVNSSLNMRDLTYNPDAFIKSLQTSELKVQLSFEPGATYINTKQRRIKVNKDAPVISVSHTMGMDGFLGGEYKYNVTEVGFFKRLYVPGGWGFISTDLKAGMQWDKVPFPLLIHPAANQSYLVMDKTFSLITPLEFLNDRYAQAMIEWNLCGKIFNRIPLLKKLQWREKVGINILYGSLSDKNNPESSGYSDPALFYFPGHFEHDSKGDVYYENNTVVMNPHRPYMELRLGIHNIFKLFHVEYVRRLTYQDNPNVNKYGIRFMMSMMF